MEMHLRFREYRRMMRTYWYICNWWCSAVGAAVAMLLKFCRWRGWDCIRAIVCRLRRLKPCILPMQIRKMVGNMFRLHSKLGKFRGCWIWEWMHSHQLMLCWCIFMRRHELRRVSRIYYIYIYIYIYIYMYIIYIYIYIYIYKHPVFYPTYER